MMDMNGGEPLTEAETAQQMQQNDRVAAAGKADAEAFGRRQTGGEKLADPTGQIN